MGQYTALLWYCIFQENILQAMQRYNFTGYLK